MATRANVPFGALSGSLDYDDEHFDDVDHALNAQFGLCGGSGAGRGRSRI